MTNLDVGNGLSDQEIQHFPSMEEKKIRRPYRKAVMCALGVGMASAVAITALAHSNSILSIPLFDSHHVSNEHYAAPSLDNAEPSAVGSASEPSVSAPAGAIRPDVESWIEQTYQGGLRAYASAIANELTSMLQSSVEGGDPASSWEALHRQVACANHDFGVSGVVLYAKVRDRVINTEQRRNLFAQAAETIAGGEGSHRHERYEATSETCISD